MRYGLETYSENGRVLSSLDKQLMTYFGGHYIGPEPNLGPYDYRVNRLYLGPESSYPSWVVAIAIVNSPPTLAWDIPELYTINNGDYINICSSKYHPSYVTVGRF